MRLRSQSSTDAARASVGAEQRPRMPFLKPHHAASNTRKWQWNGVTTASVHLAIGQTVLIINVIAQGASLIASTVLALAAQRREKPAAAYSPTPWYVSPLPTTQRTMICTSQTDNESEPFGGRPSSYVAAQLLASAPRLSCS